MALLEVAFGQRRAEHTCPAASAWPGREVDHTSAVAQIAYGSLRTRTVVQGYTEAASSAANNGWVPLANNPAARIQKAHAAVFAAVVDLMRRDGMALYTWDSRFVPLRRLPDLATLRSLSTCRRFAGIFPRFISAMLTDLTEHLVDHDRQIDQVAFAADV